MRKLRFYFDKDKEEKWLNEMCQKGWAMTKFFLGMYTFEPCRQGEYVYCVDMPGEIGKDSIGYESKREYVEFVEETGAEYVATWGWWVIFRKEAAKGEFELYTDLESRISLYKRIRKMFLWIGGLELLIGINTTNHLLSYKGSYPGDLIWIGIIYLFIVICALMSIKTTIKIKSLNSLS